MQDDRSLVDRREGIPWVSGIVGPTGTGKSAIALLLAERHGLEIVCADSRQLYRGLEVATGKPSPADRARIPHHLFDWLEPHEQTNAGRYLRAAGERIREIHARGSKPLLVGGTGLYIRALWKGLIPVPPIDPSVRESLRQALEERGPGALHRELQRVDPQSAARIAPRDRQRIVRALEVARGTGTPLSEWMEQHARRSGEIPGIHLVGLTCERRGLYARLDERTRSFFDGGLLEEVSKLLERGVPEDAPAFTGIGYAEAVSHLRGELSREEAIVKAQQATRRYAKRQWTWWRAAQEEEGCDLIETDGRSEEEILDRIRVHLLADA